MYNLPILFDSAFSSLTQFLGCHGAGRQLKVVAPPPPPPPNSTPHTSPLAEACPSSPPPPPPPPHSPSQVDVSVCFLGPYLVCLSCEEGTVLQDECSVQTACRNTEHIQQYTVFTRGTLKPRWDHVCCYRNTH